MSPVLSAPLRRFDAWWRGQPLRAQLMVLVAVVAVTVGLVDALAFGPATRERARLELRAATAQREIDALLAAAGALDAQRLAGAQTLAGRRAELAALDAEVRAARAGVSAPDEVADRLVRLMPAGGAVRATGLGSQPPQALEGIDLWRHPFELQLEGDWSGLLAHVRTIETQLGAVRWRSLELQSDDWPIVRARLEVYTLGAQPVWIRL
jgi:hypothetical protein